MNSQTPIFYYLLILGIGSLVASCAMPEGVDKLEVPHSIRVSTKLPWSSVSLETTTNGSGAPIDGLPIEWGLSTLKSFSVHYEKPIGENTSMAAGLAHRTYDFDQIPDLTSPEATLSGRYYFDSIGTFRPFVNAGLIMNSGFSYRPSGQTNKSTTSPWMGMTYGFGALHRQSKHVATDLRLGYETTLTPGVETTASGITQDFSPSGWVAQISLSYLF
jgi:hypothetical protein